MDKEMMSDLFPDFDPDMAEPWQDEWQGMPEYIQDDLEPFKSVTVHFANEEDMNKFSKLIGTKITEDTKGIWFPPEEEKPRRVYIDEP